MTRRRWLLAITGLGMLALAVAVGVGLRARRVQVFVDALPPALPALECHLQDERFTTAAAERVLLAGDVSRARRKQVIDKQAAALILQGWLDARRARPVG